MGTLKEKLTGQIKVPKISALEWLNHRKRWPLLDVRSRGEFEEGHIPDSLSAPILTNQERHLVGITYKNRGQEAAIALGLELVEPYKKERVQSWLRLVKGSVAVTCWRGGLRSRVASDWLQNAGGSHLEVVQITGGYKAIRRQLISSIESPREIIVLGGMTGSGKTQLLNELKAETIIPPVQILDLEDLAKHRGSSFGNFISEDGEKTPQPRQQTFENQMGLQLFSAQGPLVVENESSLIGKIFIPHLFRDQMKVAPQVILESPLHERVIEIFKEYVQKPLESNCSAEKLWTILTLNTKALERRLGGKETSAVLQKISEGARDPLNLELQSSWIEMLLVLYYDPAYQRSFQVSNPSVKFRGNKKEVKQWLSEHLVKRSL
jgi:tRNA 2-selenouridine synthase